MWCWRVWWKKVLEVARWHENMRCSSCESSLEVVRIQARLFFDLSKVNNKVRDGPKTIRSDRRRPVLDRKIHGVSTL